MRAAILAGFDSYSLKSPRDSLMLSAFTIIPSCSNGIINQTACCLNADEEYAKNSRCRPARSNPCCGNVSQTSRLMPVTTNLQNVANPFLQDGVPVDVPRPFELCTVLILEVHSDEEVFKARELANDTVRLCDVWSFEHHSRWHKGDVVTQECCSSCHPSCERIKEPLFWRYCYPVNTLGHRFTLRPILKLIDEVLQHLSNRMIPIETFLVSLELFVQGPQSLGVNLNDIANVQEVAPKQGFELKGNLPIGPTEKFREAVDLRLGEEVARLDFDVYRCRRRESGPTTEVYDLETGFVFVEVEDDLVSVWRHTGVGRIQGAETLTVPLYGRIAVVMFLQEERGCM